MKNNFIIAKNKAELLSLRSKRFNLLEDFATDSVLINNKQYKIRNGFTFTPFANPKACNAHCLFCSEELIPNNKNKNSSKQLIIDYEKYFKGIRNVLNSLATLNLNLSLSGLEATIDYKWLDELLLLISGYTNVKEKVLYTNGSGLINENIFSLIKLNAFDKVELSRAHYDESINQKIMLFNKNVLVRKNERFSFLTKSLSIQKNLKLSCILNADGIKNTEDVKAYLDWAIKLNVKEVVFRELSLLHENYLKNKTFNWIEDKRVEVIKILQEIEDNMLFVYSHSTGGYYYYNETYVYKESISVIFETSSYSALKDKNQSGVIHKLIFHSNGNLTTDWDNETSVISNFYE